MARDGNQIIHLTAEISCDKSKTLGNGSVACVFPGTMGNFKVAIKRITNENFNNLEDSAMKTLDHPNVLKFYDLIEDSRFKYIILELCDATVEEYCQGTYTGKVPPDCHALFQMADGLQYLHSKGFAHRDISPNNVLIKLINDEAVMKISDFGVCKPASETGSFSMSDDGCKGTWFYIAPELLIPMNNNQKCRGHINNDIFSLGCVFFRFLTKGGHPFFDPSENADGIRLNILNNKQFLEGLGDDRHYLKDLIAKMIVPEPELIPQTAGVEHQNDQNRKLRRPDMETIKEILRLYLNLDFRLCSTP